MAPVKRLFLRDSDVAAEGLAPIEGDVGFDALLAGCASAADDDELFGVGVAGGVGHGISPVIVRLFSGVGRGEFGLQLGAFFGRAGVGSAGGLVDAEAGAGPEFVFAVPDGPDLSFGELLFHFFSLRKWFTDGHDTRMGA